MSNLVIVEPGDILFTRGSTLLSRLIRWAQTDPKEEETWANHVGIVVKGGALSTTVPTWMQAEVVEALWKVELNRWAFRHATDKEYAFRVYRPLELDWCLPFVVHYALKQVNKSYGWWKLFAHLGDRLIFRGKKVISRMLFVEEKPICSYLVAHAFEQCGVTFGMPADATDPDEMLDYCEAHPNKFKFVGEGELNNELAA